MCSGGNLGWRPRPSRCVTSPMLPTVNSEHGLPRRGYRSPNTPGRATAGRDAASGSGGPATGVDSANLARRRRCRRGRALRPRPALVIVIDTSALIVALADPEHEAMTNQLLESMRDLRIERYAHTALAPRLWALRHNPTAYDTTFVALAEVLVRRSSPPTRSSPRRRTTARRSITPEARAEQPPIPAGPRQNSRRSAHVATTEPIG